MHSHHEPDASREADLGEEDMAQPVAEDMGTPDMPEACDEEAVSKSLVAVHETVTAGASEFTQLERGWRATIDAAAGGAAVASDSSFLYVDLDTGAVLELSDAAAYTDSAWDIALKRTEVRINSQDSGPGALLLVEVEAESFEAAMPPGPQDGNWRGDDFVDEMCEVVTFGRGSIQTAFGQWYDYNPETHAISAPEGRVYFLYNAATHGVYKLQIEAYEDAIYTLRWE
ncbi:unnamed protein product [Laminaria digitata]